MKRLLLIISLMFLVIACEQEEPHYVRYVANKEGIKVYKNPNENSQSIATIPYKTKVEVEGDPTKKEWVEVEFYENGKEIEGYVKSSELTAIEPTEEPSTTTTTTDTLKTDTTKTDTTAKAISENTQEKKQEPKHETPKKEIKKETPKPITTTIKEKNKPKSESKPKQETKPETKSQKSKLAAEAGLIDPSLLTYNKGLKDAEVNSNSLYTWNASSSSYKGTYEGPLASNISKLELKPAGNSLKGTIYYSVEEVSPMTGMIESKETSATITINPATGKVIISAPNLKITKAEFVKWGSSYGVILKVSSPTTAYVLLKKTH